jgi:GT2 family glycosyltransferase
MGDRPDALARAVASIAAQRSEATEIVVVVNGGDATVPEPARPIRLAENVGIAAGRNIGALATDADVVFFLDDDADCPDPGLADGTLAAFEADPRLGVVSFRVVDPMSGESQRRHVPRLRANDPQRSSDVTTFLGGACAIRRDLFVRIGGYPERFFYAMEETDFAWAALDLGYRIAYRGDLVVEHPATTPARHGHALRSTARNRVWLAQRRLPAVLRPLYLAVWAAITFGRARSLPDLRATLAGFRDGLRDPAADRRVIGWRTIAHMTRLGRPPIV